MPYERNAVAESRTIERANAPYGVKLGEHAWRCGLGPLGFSTGTVDAGPGRLDRSVGFSVAFDAPEDEHEGRRMVRDAARFLPTDVHLDATMCSQRPYTSGCASTAVEDGYRFGIIPRAVGKGPDLSLHGRLVCAFLPSVDTLEGTWSVRAEVTAWPEGLELDGDVRKTVIENEAVDHLRQLAEKVLFETLGSAAPTPGLSDADLERARKAGVDLAPGARLRPWLPAVEGGNSTRARTARPVQVGEDGLVVDFDAPQPAREGQMLQRAAARAGIAGRLFAPEPATRGQRWYATLPRIVDVRTKVRVGNETRDADDELAASWTADRRRVDAIVVEARIMSADGAERTMKLPTDVAIGGGREAFDVDDKAVFLAEDAQIDFDELTTLVMATSTGEGADSDSGERYGDFGMAAEYVAARALEDREAADRRQIARAVRNALMGRIRRDPDDEETIRIAIRGKDVEVAIENNQQA